MWMDTYPYWDTSCTQCTVCVIYYRTPSEIRTPTKWRVVLVANKSGVLYRTKLAHVPTTQYMYVDVHTSYQHALWHVHLCVAHGRPRSHVRSSECLAFNVPACRHWPFVYLPIQLAKFPRQVLFSGVASAWYLCCVFTVTRQ